MIKLELSIEETNKIIFALAEQPYKHVADLIAKVREQAVPQAESKKEEANGGD